MKTLLIYSLCLMVSLLGTCQSGESIPPVDRSNGVNTAKQLDRFTKDLSIVDSIIIYNNKNSSILKLGKAKPGFYEYYMLVNGQEIDLTYALVTSFGPKYMGDLVIYIKEPIPYTPIRR